MPPKRTRRRPTKEEELKDPEFLNEEEDEELADEPPVINPYEVLGLEKTATQDEVKSAYRKAALIHHPDKAKEEDKSAAHTKFQEIAFAYAILSDEHRRKRYDTTGRTDESVADDEDFNWQDFYRAQFADVITQESIDKFSKEYKGSEEEKEALIDAYNQYEGNLSSVYESVMCSDILEDDDRFRRILDAEIAAGNIEAYPQYANETDETRQKAKDQEIARRKKFDQNQARKKAKEEKAGKKKKDDVSDLGSLAAMIQQRQKERAGGAGANFFDRLEEKYGPKGRKRASPMDEPPEEAFQKNAKKSKKGKSGK